MFQDYKLHNGPLHLISNYKALITTLNAHCYNIAQIDPLYQEALIKSDILIPDGISIVGATLLLTGQRLKKIAGEDLFFFEMQRLQQKGGKCFFLGSTLDTLTLIKEKLNREFSNIQIKTYSPSFTSEFSNEENASMIEAINGFHPDVLMVGMTAPKQEKWAYKHFNQLEVGHICCIGAVFDFYAGTVKRAPQWMIKMGLEWFYRLIREPRRMWQRYLIGNIKFVWYIIKEKIQGFFIRY